MYRFSVFASESVSEGHPDKVAIQISDVGLDAMIAQDPNSQVACETLTKTDLVVLPGEFRSDAKSQIGFRPGSDGKSMAIEAVVLSTQHAPDVSQARLWEAVTEEIIKSVLEHRKNNGPKGVVWGIRSIGMA